MVTNYQKIKKMKKVLLLAVLTLNFICCDTDDDNETVTPTVYDIEGKWTFANNNLNTMYIFEDGIRYTYYCVGDDCESQYETFEAGDSNAILGTNEYTFENGILTIDLNFGNELVAPLTFECDGGKVYLDSPNPYHLYRLGSVCD